MEGLLFAKKRPLVARTEAPELCNLNELITAHVSSGGLLYHTHETITSYGR